MLNDEIVLLSDIVIISCLYLVITYLWSNATVY